MCDQGGLPGAALLDRSDLYFFDYPAQNELVKASASDLAGFLHLLFPMPDMSLFFQDQSARADIRNPWHPYRTLLLVGHSLGALVIRECVENQFRLPGGQPPAWVSACKLCLLGGAHIGFRPRGWTGFISEVAPQMLLSIPRLWRAFHDLQTTSQVIVELRKRTEALAAARPELRCFRAHLLYGTKECLVEPGEFDCDYTMSWVENVGHIQICKPDKAFPDPINFVTSDGQSTTAKA
jgi:pimeloyl-ACP methyl ester carboxylesterase